MRVHAAIGTARLGVDKMTWAFVDCVPLNVRCTVFVVGNEGELMMSCASNAEGSASCTAKKQQRKRKKGV